MTKRKSDDGSAKATTRRRIIKPKADPATGTKPPAAKPARTIKKPKAEKPAQPAPAKTTPPESTPEQKKPAAAAPVDYMSLTVEELEQLMEPKQILFCLEFIKTFNGTQAAKNAKYSPKTAGQIAAENLKKPVIQAYLAKVRDTMFQEVKVDGTKVLQQIARLGFSDVRNLFDENGTLKDVRKLGDDIAAAVQSIEIERRTEGRGEEKETYFVHKIRMVDKKGPLEMLARHLQLFTKAEDDEEAAAARKTDARTKAMFAELIADATSRNQQTKGNKK